MGFRLAGPREPGACVIHALDHALSANPNNVENTVVLLLQTDGYDALQARYHPIELEDAFKTFAKRLKGGLASLAQVHPLAGGQFACILKPHHDMSTDQVMAVASQIQTLMAKPLIRGEKSATMTVSIGCAMTQMADFANGTTMFEAARVAVAKAARKGPGGLQFFTAPMGKELALRQGLRDDIRQAVHSGAIQAFYQPQIALATGALSGFEALARWDHPRYGLVAPGAFLPVFEDLGMMRILGRIMLRDALRALAAWDADGFDVPGIAVNMCAEELGHADVVQDITYQLEQHKIAPHRLVIEVLETVYADSNDDPIIQNLLALSALGCRLDLDDFGTGYASIKSVRHFAVNRVKIDRSFITDIATDREQQQVVRTILSMAEHMQVSTLAEGVETVEEMDFLTKAGCQHAQGYVIGRPVCWAKATDWLRSHGDIRRAESAV